MTFDEHRHCKVCGKTCGPEEQTCSEACRLRRTATLRTRRLYTYLLYGITLFIVLVVVLPYLGVR